MNNIDAVIMSFFYCYSVMNLLRAYCTDVKGATHLPVEQT